MAFRNPVLVCSFEHLLVTLQPFCKYLTYEGFLV